MRILHVTHELPPYETAGTAIYTLNIARAQAVDHDVFVFARLQDPELVAYGTHTEERDGLIIRFLNLADLEWSPFERSYDDPRAQKIFLEFLAEVGPDVVHFQHILGLGKGLLEAVRKAGIPTAFTLHDFWAMCPMGQRMCYTDEVICDPIDFSKCGPCAFGDGWQDVGRRETSALDTRDNHEGEVERSPTMKELFARRFMETPGLFARRPLAAFWALRNYPRTRRRKVTPDSEPFTTNPFEHRFNVLCNALRDVDLLITPSAFVRDEFIRHAGIAGDRIIHSANGMDFKYVKALPKTKSDVLRFGFVGSIIRTKGPHVAVEAFLQVAENHDDVELHVYGAPNRWSVDYLKALEARAKAHPNGNRVRFRGRFDNSRIGDVLSEIDVLVVPSIWFENAPLTLNEAAMTRTPIIVSDRGGMLEFVRANEYGRTFELGNAESLALVMAELAEDRSQIAELAGNPPPIKQVDDNAEELVRIYEALIQGSYAAPSLAEQTSTRGGCVRQV